MRFCFIDGHRREFPIRLMCDVLQVSPSGYYAWRRRPHSAARRRWESLCDAVREVFESVRGIYGSPRVHRELLARGIACCVNTVAKIMQELGLRSKVKRRFRPTTNSDHAYEVAPNALDRQFDQAAPNQAWSSDITYVPTGEGWMYLAVVQDVFSRRIIGWSMADHLRTELATSALTMALQHRSDRPAGLIHHSDQGVQYASDAYQQILDDHLIAPSMSRKGDCWDNAVTESFFGSLKTELVHHERYATRAEAKQSIFNYIERFYNRQRRHSTLGYVSPAEYEMAHH
jgi:transposase InsO family protein